MKLYLNLFWTMFKIGLFTFGGGHAMIALFESEFVSKKKWIEHDEFMNIVVIAESTPGPIAINTATYIGYKMGKFLGSLICTIGVCLPSFIIIYLISLFFNEFLNIGFVASAFKGIQVCAIFLIFSAGIKMLIKMKKNLFNILVFLATVCVMVLFSLFAINFSSIFYILISAFLGLFIYLLGNLRKRKNDKKEEDKE